MADRTGACRIGKATTGGGWQRIGSDVGMPLCNGVNDFSRKIHSQTGVAKNGLDAYVQEWKWLDDGSCCSPSSFLLRPNAFRPRASSLVWELVSPSSSSQ